MVGFPPLMLLKAPGVGEVEAIMLCEKMLLVIAWPLID